jgi:hypothetical protein
MDMSELLFPVESEYNRCLSALKISGILKNLPVSKNLGIIGFDSQEYPLPTLHQIKTIFASNLSLLGRKLPQGFNQLELTSIAMPVPSLIQLLEAAIIKHAAEGNVFQTRHTPSGPLTPVRVNKEKHVWVWETLRQVEIEGKFLYFPQEYSQNNHRGLTKLESIHDPRVCAIPGWSIGLVENMPVMPRQSQGKTLSGRKQLEVGLSPREYLTLLHTPPYQGETGKLLEDFLTEFLIQLETTGEVSYILEDSNCLWCLGQYTKIPYAEVVPTGSWRKGVGRVRLDMHRTGNKLCTKNCGASTVVRLSAS